MTRDLIVVLSVLGTILIAICLDVLFERSRDLQAKADVVSERVAKFERDVETLKSVIELMDLELSAMNGLSDPFPLHPLSHSTAAIK